MKIDKKIPLPNKQKMKYPWADMEVGDSVLCEDSSARTAAHNWGKSRNIKFTGQKGKEGYRVWRIE